MLTREQVTGGAAGDERLKRCADELEAIVRAGVSKECAEAVMELSDPLTIVAQKLSADNPALAFLMRAYNVSAGAVAVSSLSKLALEELAKRPDDVGGLRVSAQILRRSADLLDQFLATKN